MYKITIAKIELGSASGATATTESIVFTQTLEELNLSKFVTALNKPVRIRKPKAAK